jgi:hypothetical protein
MNFHLTQFELQINISGIPEEREAFSTIPDLDFDDFLGYNFSQTDMNVE